VVGVSILDETPGEAGDRIRHDLARIATWGATTSTRSQQRAPGPSEVGHPCARRVAYRVANAPHTDPEFDPWPAIVGTASHAWLADTITRANAAAGRERFLVETPVLVHDAPRLAGTVDLYDTDTRTVIDHKVLGAASLKAHTTHGPKPGYVAQVNLYAVGLLRAGHDVEHVAIATWPRSGLTTGLRVWTAPVDVELACRVIDRYERITTAVRADPDVGDHATTTPGDDCSYCPWRTRCATAGGAS
jgi:hypothetical protein